MESSASVSRGTSFKFEGGRALEAALRQLSKATARNVAKRALKKAADPIASKARQLAPKDKGNLEKAIQVSDKAKVGSRGWSNRGDWVTMFVGINGNVLPPKDSKTRMNKRKSRFLQSGGGVAAYSIFVERGTGSMKAQPYMRPAWDAEKGKSVERIAPELWDEISKAAARAARKGAK